MCSSPPPPSSSTWKRLTTMYSRGLMMLAKCGLTSEFMYSNSTGITGAHASTMSAKVCFRSSWMTRISVGVESRPSMRVWNLPVPPKKLSTVVKTRRGSNTTSAVPRSGFIFTRLRLFGTCSECMYSPKRIRSMPRTDRSAERRSRLNRPMRQVRAKRSLIISSVGSLPRTMRSWLAKSYWRASPGAGGASVGTAPLSTPCRRASISSWESRSAPIMASALLLRDQAGEVDGFDLVRRAFALEHGAHFGEGLCLQVFLAAALRQRLRRLLAEQQQQAVAQGGRLRLQRGERGGIARHQLHVGLQVMHGVGVGEIDHEGRIHRVVLRGRLDRCDLGRRLGRGARLPGPPAAATAGAEHHAGDHDPHDLARTALFRGLLVTG